MATPRKDTKLARVRDEAKQIRKAAETAPLAFVLPPIAQLLGTVQAVAGNELKAMLVEQEQNPGSRLSNDDAKKLATLTDALCKAHGAEKDLSDAELGKMTDEELEKSLLEELERIRSKKG